MKVLEMWILFSSFIFTSFVCVGLINVEVRNPGWRAILVRPMESRVRNFGMWFVGSVLKSKFV